MKLNQQQIKYYNTTWKSKRRCKLKYILKESMLYWALPFSIVMILFELYDNGFAFSVKTLKSFIIVYLTSSILGIIPAIYAFKKNEKHYLAATQNQI